MSIRTRRILMSAGGVMLGGISVGGFKYACLGVDPFQSLMGGIDALVPVSFGTLYVLVNLLLLTFSLVTDRKNIGLATFINLFLLGYVTEFSHGWIVSVLPQNPSMVLKLGMLAGSLVLMCIGSALYMTAHLGVSTYDAVAIVLSEKWKVGRFKYCRIGADLVCVALGVLLYLIAGKTWQQMTEIVGIGTLITAFMMGPLISFFNRTVAEPLLREKSK